jgi:hypothetical protein
MKRKATKTPFAVMLEDDFIFIIEATNKYGYKFTIAIEATEEKAQETVNSFNESRAGSDYWKRDKEGKIVLRVLKKLVPGKEQKPSSVPVTT